MITIKSIRKRVLSILLIGFILLFFVLIVQSFSGKYGSQTYVPWVWFITLYMAPILVLFSIKERTKKINTSGIIILTLVYVFGTLLVILLQPFVAFTREEPTYLAFTYTLKISALFLIPLELLLIYIYHKKLFVKEIIGKITLDPKVFISYNHNDRTTALKIKAVIEKESIPVIIDVVDMKAGTDIKEFIQNSLKEVTTIVSLVSNNSLKSAWVAKESIDSLFLETYLENKKFIACYLDDDFFQNDYTLKTISKIDLQIKEVQDNIEQSHVIGIDTRDLNNQKSRLIALRNSLDGIIGRLRDSLCLDVREESFDQSILKLIDAIQEDS